MNQKLNNTCIKCESVEHGAEIVKFYEDNGINTIGMTGGRIGRYYGVFDGHFNNCSLPNNEKVLTLQEAKELLKENQYPKVMWVRYNETAQWEKRVVFMEKEGGFLAWTHAETFEAAEKEIYTSHWNYAKDIEEETEFQTKTRERIAAIERELEELKKLIK